MSVTDVACPYIGGFKDVLVIDVLVKAGDVIKVEDPLVTLETDKATMDVPSSAAGRVVEVLVARGAKVSQGTLLARVEAAGAGDAPVPAAKPAAVSTLAASAAPAAPASPARVAAPAATAGPEPAADRDIQLLVLGAGPGGYTAAFRAADLGLKVMLVDRWATLGGVCMNVGCIPSKALLHAAKVIDDARAMGAHGIEFGAPRIDFAKLREWKNKVVGKLTGGLAALAKQRKAQDSACASSNASLRSAPSRSRCRSCRAIRESWTRPARSSCRKIPAACW